MAYNKVVYDNNVLIDLTDDTVTADNLLIGKTAHGADGEPITGTLETEYQWRPHDGMPDLMSVDLSNVDDCVLWTYDASDCDLWIAFKITTKSTVNLDVQMGTIVDGVFVSETTLTAKSNAEVRIAFPTTQYTYPVLRILSSSPMYTVQSINYKVVTEYISGMAQMIVDGRIKGTNITGLTSNRPFPQAMEHVTLENITKWTSWSTMFSSASNLRQIDFVNCDTAKVTTMYQAFYYCRALKKITGYENFNVEKVTRMDYMFSGSPQIMKIDLSNWNSIALTTMGNMFNNCKGIIELKLNGLVTSNVTTLINTFKDCSALTKLDIHLLDTHSVTDFSSTFANMTSLQEINVSGLDISSGTTFANCFNNDYSLRTLDLSTWTLPTVADKAKITQFAYGITGLHTFYIPDNICYAISLSYSALSKDSLDYLVEHLGTAASTSETITLSSCRGKLSAEQKTAITDKGWTLA